nr:uncharacterized protein LOC110091191 [Pogona vitticeps]XP_020670874.1 uncharacterized protein LOC110091191 [Pogona vitticeps]XP_020670875.1 uncharacterized protein LOC110091191 [Pogona vitticeps]
MRDDSNVFEPLLDEEDLSRSKSMRKVFAKAVRKASFQEKLWEFLSQSSVALCPTFQKSVGYGVPCVTHKPSMTETDRPWVKRKMVILVISLSVLLELIFLCILLCFSYNPSTGPQDLPKEDGIKARKNMTAAVSVVPENLTLATLLAAETEEPQGGAMRNCLEKAVQEFSEEPSIVKKNTRMILQCNGTKREFLSGKGGNLIEVVWINEKVSYTLVHEAHPDVYLARLGRHPLPLNISSIQSVLQDVASHNGSEELRSCLRKALAELPWEPVIVQDNAKMVVSCGGTNLAFISGKGQTEINVYREDPHGEIQYAVKATGWAWFLRPLTRRKIN